MVTNGVMKQVYRLFKNISSLTLNQARISEWDPDFMSRIEIEICPSDGLYQGAKFKFVILMGEDYPDEPPRVFCQTPIYHPNIDSTDEEEEGYSVCLNMFDEDMWSRQMGLEECVIGLLYLLYNPNLDDPLSPWFSPVTEINEFEDNVRKSLDGETVEDVTFDANKENSLEKPENDGIFLELSKVFNQIDLNETEGAEDNTEKELENQTYTAENQVDHTVKKDAIQELTINSSGLIQLNGVMFEMPCMDIKELDCGVDMATVTSHVKEPAYTLLTTAYSRPLAKLVTLDLTPCAGIKIKFPLYGEFTIYKDCWADKPSFACVLARDNSTYNREIVGFRLESEPKVELTNEATKSVREDGVKYETKQCRYIANAFMKLVHVTPMLCK